MMQIRIIKTPSEGARALIRRRLGYLKDLPETIDTTDDRYGLRGGYRGKI